MRWIICAIAAFIWVSPIAAVAQEQAGSAFEEAATAHIMALEQAAMRPLDELIEEFETQRFAASYMAETTAGERRALLSSIRDAAAAAGGAGVDQDDQGFLMSLEGASVYQIRISIAEAAPHRIDGLAIEELAAPAALSLDTLEADIDALMTGENRSGLVYVRVDGEVVMQKAYGMAIAELGIPVGTETIFGIGSRPIDFTMAAIYLLESQERLSRDDTLGDHFPDVPGDRAGMTLRQMMTGQSGLPDFPANESDWDADLGWIDRAEFERRTMAIPLLFAPGEGDAHSHWAFGLLAAIVERVSGTSYYEFLRENFFDRAGMERTGNYGEIRDLEMADFAAGRGIQRGLPNIPPNWGPTSWLVMGSGGMYSTLGDLERFYTHVTREGVIGDVGRAYFLGERAQLDGSDRGFELFSFDDEERSDAVYVFLNSGGGPGATRPFVRPFINLLREN